MIKGYKEELAPVRVLTGDDGQYFFGYYDLQPFDLEDKRHLCHKVGFRDRLPTKNDVCEIGCLDDSLEFKKLAETTAWNFQQGALLQWYGNDSICYNIRKGDGFGLRIQNLKTGENKEYPFAAANISADGKHALCLNMSRIYDFRPGYGYSDLPDRFYDINSPLEDGIVLMDLATGEAKQIISYQDMVKQFPCEPYTDCKLVVNHITFNPKGDRFLFLLRNFRSGAALWKTQLITSDLEGNMCKLSEYISNSHYHWKNDKQILIITDYLGTVRDNLCLRDDITGEGIIYDLPELHKDIHCLYSPNKRYILGDSYQDSENYRSILLFDTKENTVKTLVKVYSEPPVLPDIRCDLHARWNRKGNKITFDSNHCGRRCICEMDLSKIVEF